MTDSLSFCIVYKKKKQTTLETAAVTNDPSFCIFSVSKKYTRAVETNQVQNTIASTAVGIFGAILPSFFYNGPTFNLVKKVDPKNCTCTRLNSNIYCT